MKKYLVLVILLPLLSFGQLKTIHFTWDRDLDTTNNWFLLHQSDTFTLTPLDLWPPVTNVFGTNWITLQVTKDQHYFVMRATNWWGYSDFSVVVSTPRAPQSSPGFRVLRGD